MWEISRYLNSYWCYHLLFLFSLNQEINTKEILQKQNFRNLSSKRLKLEHLMMMMCQDCIIQIRKRRRTINEIFKQATSDYLMVASWLNLGHFMYLVLLSQFQMKDHSRWVYLLEQPTTKSHFPRLVCCCFFLFD